MTTIQLSIDERDKREYQLRGDMISFEELELRVLAKEGMITLGRANELAKKTRISGLALREIRNGIRTHGKRKK